MERNLVFARNAFVIAALLQVIPVTVFLFVSIWGNCFISLMFFIIFIVFIVIVDVVVVVVIIPVVIIIVIIYYHYLLYHLILEFTDSCLVARLLPYFFI